MLVGKSGRSVLGVGLTGALWVLVACEGAESGDGGGGASGGGQGVDSGRRAPDAAVEPTPDAGVEPTPDAAVAPTPDAAVGLEPDAAVVAEPDALVPPEPGAQLCFRPVFDLGRWCGARCEADADCSADEMCAPTERGGVCVPDCRALGCPAGLVCSEETGHCAARPEPLPGAPCASTDDCATCCRWTVIPGLDDGDPAWWECLPVRPGSPEGGTCSGYGACEACQARAGNRWRYEGTEMAGCDFEQGPGHEECRGVDNFGDPICSYVPAPPVDSGTCVADADLCWNGACACLNSQWGECLVPVSEPGPPVLHHVALRLDRVRGALQARFEGEDPGRDVDRAELTLLGAQGVALSTASVRVPATFSGDGDVFSAISVTEALAFSQGIPAAAVEAAVELVDSGGLRSERRVAPLEDIVQLLRGDPCTADRFEGVCAAGDRCEPAPDGEHTVCTETNAPVIAEGRLRREATVRAIGLDLLLAPPRVGPLGLGLTLHVRGRAAPLPIQGRLGGVPNEPDLLLTPAFLAVAQPDGRLRLRAAVDFWGLWQIDPFDVESIDAVVYLVDGTRSESVRLMPGPALNVEADGECTRGPLFDLCPAGQACMTPPGAVDVQGRCVPVNPPVVLSGQALREDGVLPGLSEIGVRATVSNPGGDPIALNVVPLDAAGVPLASALPGANFGGYDAERAHASPYAEAAGEVSVLARWSLTLDPAGWAGALVALRVAAVGLDGVPGPAIDLPLEAPALLEAGDACAPDGLLGRCDGPGLCRASGSVAACVPVDPACPPEWAVVDLETAGPAPWTHAGPVAGGAVVPESGLCRGSGPSTIVRFIPPADGRYRATLTRVPDEWTTLSARSHCGVAEAGSDLGCVYAWDGPPELRLLGVAGEPITLLVNETPEGVGGAFELVVEPE